jgi:hypothetical protein
VKFVSAACAAIIFVGTIAAAAAQDVVEIRIRGRFYAEPATVRMTIAVRPDESNRTLVVQADGDRLFRSSEVALDGAKGERLHTVEFKNLPAGHYVLRAEVHSSRQLRGIAEELLIVGEPGDQR